MKKNIRWKQDSSKSKFNQSALAYHISYLKKELIANDKLSKISISWKGNKSDVNQSSFKKKCEKIAGKKIGA